MFAEVFVCPLVVGGGRRGRGIPLQKSSVKEVAMIGVPRNGVFYEGGAMKGIL